METITGRIDGYEKLNRYSLGLGDDYLIRIGEQEFFDLGVNGNYLDIGEEIRLKYKKIEMTGALDISLNKLFFGWRIPKKFKMVKGIEII